MGIITTESATTRPLYLQFPGYSSSRRRQAGGWPTYWELPDRQAAAADALTQVACRGGALLALSPGELV